MPSRTLAGLRGTNGELPLHLSIVFVVLDPLVLY